MTILAKKEMSEEDIKLQFITPAILDKWDKNRITMETKITDGKICLNGNFVHRDKKSAKYADYVLYWNSGFPIAIVEAKDNNHGVSFGLQQAITYAKMMDVPFAYSSNGDAFYEHDLLTGKEREILLPDFPTPDELIERYTSNANKGNGLSADELTVPKNKPCKRNNRQISDNTKIAAKQGNAEERPDAGCICGGVGFCRVISVIVFICFFSFPQGASLLFCLLATHTIPQEFEYIQHYFSEFWELRFQTQTISVS